ncbi:SnoaL-like protein [Murinocardiopsis flavida]|uniref:SnoaL-like protein n=1 Tax=Murinocardiopsis flavida TaxID=645275 RepID=A0A2P8DUG7_9ACTN|nr:nuclear transport factor 2 family protein [Murinocardiopsis flavida]PSL00866.1 SnoaL-like protein [Murinocardiopsis flavida]
MADAAVPEPVASFIDTVNSHDESGFLDAFTPDGAVDDWGRTFTGRQAIKAWSDNEFIGARGTLTPEDVTTEGDRVVVVGDWRSEHANGLSRFTFDIAGDRIAMMTIREG